MRRLRLPGEREASAWLTAARTALFETLPIVMIGFLLMTLGFALGSGAGHSAGAEERAALSNERDTLELQLEGLLWTAEIAADRLERCVDANESSVLALEALAAREDGCRKFLCLDPYSNDDTCSGAFSWIDWRLARAGERR